MQLLSCHIAVAGDDANIVVRDYDTAVTYPELLLLKALHGSENVRHIADAGDVERGNDEERSRLRELYGETILKQVFPGDFTELPEHDRKMRKAATVFDDDKQEKDPPKAKAEEPAVKAAPAGKHR